MNNAVVLAQLRQLRAETPTFSTYAPQSLPHLEWLAKVFAILNRWSPAHAAEFRSYWNYLPGSLMRDTAVAGLLAVLHRSVEELSLDAPATPKQAFGPGAVYDFLVALREILESATASILIVDPYLNGKIFDAYLSDIPSSVVVRLLTNEPAKALGPVVEAFAKQTQRKVEIRASRALHDRVIFVDDQWCWALGQSIKDAASTKPTYLVPLPSDTAQLKREAYENIWNAAQPA